MTQKLLLHNKNIKNCYNRAAKTYDFACSLQKTVCKQLIKNLIPYKYTASNIIDLGCGTGLSTEKIISTYKEYTQVYAIDIADQLLITAKKRLNHYNITILEQSFESFYVPNISFDLAFSNMAIHWSRNIGATLFQIYKNLSINGVLAFSMPIDGTFNELPSASTIPFYQLEYIKLLIKQSNLKVLHTSNNRFVNKFGSLIEALKSIKLTGSHYYGLSKNNLINSGTPNLNHLLRSRKLSNKSFNLTYNIGFFIVIKNSSQL